MSSASRKRILVLASVLSGGLFVFSYTVNLWAERKLAFVEAALSEALQRPVEIHHAGYMVFRGFTLDRLVVKEIKTVPVPFTIQRVRAMPQFELFPKPVIRIHKLIFEDPKLGIVGKPEELFRAGALIRKLPVYRSQVGRVTLEMKLTSFEIRKGRVTVFTDTRGGEVRQEFEHIEFFAGESGFQKNRMRLSGRIAGKPQAYFRVESDLLREEPGALDTNIRIDLHEFTTSYLAPYLKDRFKLPEKNLTASLRFKIRNSRHIESDGTFDLPSIGFDDRLLRYLTRRTPKLRYFVTGERDEDGISFDKIFLKGRRVRLSGEGRIDLAEGRESYRFSLASGDVAVDGLKGVSDLWEPESGTARISVEASGSPKVFEPHVQIELNNVSIRQTHGHLRFSNTQGVLHLTPTSARTDELWTFVNDFPLRVAGSLRSGKRRFVSLELSSYPGQIPNLKKTNPVNGSIRVRAAERNGLWNGYARVEQEDYKAKNRSLDTLVLAFRRLAVKDRECAWLVIRSFEKAGRTQMHPLVTRDIHFTPRFDLKRLRLDLDRSTVHEGNARGAFRLDLANGSWKTRFDLRGARLGALMRDFFIDYPADGRLTLRGHWTGGKQKNPVMAMRFDLRDGSVGPSPSLKKWADQTGIEALSFIRFERFHGEVSLRDGLWKMQKISLRSVEAALTADFQVREGRVNGRLSVRFPTTSIRSGSALSWLLAFVRQQDWVDFDFHLAGSIEAPRVEWLAGEFRKKIERRIPSFLRGALARQIEQRLAVA